MIELTGVELNNVVYFKKAKLDITRHPFVVITGHNKDSRISTETSNGAGKSLLLSSVPNLRYEQTPLASQKSKKDMLSSSASSIKLDLKSNDGKSYSITQTASKFLIERDGKDLEARTIQIQKAEIERIFPLSEEEFYSYVYLQSQRPLAFQVDRSPARLHYITSVFRLDVYDRLKKYFTKKLGEIKNKQIEFDVLSNQLIKVNGLLERLEWSKERAEELEAAREVIKTLGGDANKLQSKIERLKSALAVSEKYVKLKKQRKQLKPTISAKQAKAELELHEAITEYESDLKTYKAQKKSFTQQIEEIGKVRSVEKLEKLVKKLIDHQAGEESCLTMLHEARQFYKSVVKEYDEAVAKLKDFKIKSKEVDVVVVFGTKKYEDEIAKYGAVLQLESIVSDCADGECPTCQQSVNVQEFKKQIKAAKNAVAEAKQGVKKYNVCKEVFDLKHKLKKHEFDEKNEKEFLARREEYKIGEERLEKLQEELRNAKTIQKITKRLSELEKPVEPQRVPTMSKKALREVLEQHSELNRVNALIESLEDQHGTIDSVKLSNTLEESQKRYKKIERKYVKAQDVCSSLGSKASEYKVLRRERKDAIEKLKALEPIIAQRDLYKTLEKAYSKELKVYAANQVLSQLEQNLNRYSNLIFAEPFKFSVHADDKGVHCIVDRGNGKKSDVRLLSGAESDSFRLLFFYVMVIMADDSRRTNFAVLDEPDSHMDDTTRSLFIERFIPALRNLVPHVFLITPLNKHAYSECAYLTVVKHKGVSKLVEDM